MNRGDRVDFSVYNEASLFGAASGNLAGRSAQDVFDMIESGGVRLAQAVAGGLVLPLGLWQDDSFNARVLLGDLNEREAEEWVVRAQGWLSIPDGRLAVGGGWAVVERLAVPNEDYWKDFYKVTDVPPGDYRVEVLGYLPGTALYPFKEAAQNGEPLGTWFRRTRSGEKFPDWLASWIMDDVEETDPGHTDFWAKQGADFEGQSWEELNERRQKGYVEYLFRLEPLSGDPPQTQMSEDGFCLAWEVRKPERCPLGVPSTANNGG
jgi:hypothetical protein